MVILLDSLQPPPRYRVPHPPVCLMLIRGTSWLARIIQRATGSPYSHVAFMIGDVTYEADAPNGVQSRIVKCYAWPFDLYRVDGLDADRSIRLHRWCQEKLSQNVGYDWGKVIGTGLDLLLHTTGFRPLLDSRRTFTCSEFIWEGLHHVGIDLSVSQTHTTPGWIATDPRVHRV